MALKKWSEFSYKPKKGLDMAQFSDGLILQAWGLAFDPHNPCR